MNAGFIGTGNMGKILIEAFIESNALKPSAIHITNRTFEKAANLKKQYPKINLYLTPEEIARQSELIFICVKPLDIHPLLIKLSPYLRKDQCIISITSPINVEQLQSIVDCQVARAIPSITNRALSGVSLLTYGNCSPSMRKSIEELFQAISNPFTIEDHITRVSSDIVSCGPAFFSYLLQRFIDAAVRETEITKHQAVQLTSEMVIGLGKLLESELYTLPTLQEKVCVKGGVTGEGISVMEAEIGEVFEHLFQRTHRKYNEDLREVKEQFESMSDT
ncbi:late competence protein ComER [Bacillus sp. F19]|nr:late competence protein ComER [Bacillus sp. F19]